LFSSYNEKNFGVFLCLTVYSDVRPRKRILQPVQRFLLCVSRQRFIKTYLQTRIQRFDIFSRCTNQFL